MDNSLFRTDYAKMAWCECLTTTRTQKMETQQFLLLSTKLLHLERGWLVIFEASCSVLTFKDHHSIKGPDLRIHHKDTGLRGTTQTVYSAIPTPRMPDCSTHPEHSHRHSNYCEKYQNMIPTGSVHLLGNVFEFREVWLCCLAVK